MTRFKRAFGAIAGLLPLLVAMPLYQLGLLITNQASAWRMLGTMAALSLGLAVAAALAAGLAVALGLDRLAERHGRGLGAGVVLAFVAALLAVGLCVFHWSPRLAPGAWQLGAAAIWLLAAALVWRQTPDERAQAVAGVLRLGRLALVVPWLATPWVLHGWSTHVSRLPRSVAPTTSAVKATAPKRIVLVTFDALRARSTSVQHPGSGATPTLEAIAQEGHYYTQCRSAGDQTIVSIATILTGLRPMRIFPYVNNRLGYLTAGAATGLAGHLAPAGYRSYYATMLINPSVFGLAREFTHGVAHAPTMMENAFNTASYLPLGEAAGWLTSKLAGRDARAPIEPQRLRASRRTLDDARAFLKSAPDKTFLWVHLGLPHDQYYDVPPEADDGTRLDPYKAHRADLVTLKRGDAAQLAHIERVYEAYVRFGDRELGRFVAGLKADGLWNDSLVVVTSDHGEEFTPTFAGHGRGQMTEDSTRVPLIIRAPGLKPARIDSQVVHRDIAPTILSQVYEVPPPLAGRSLLAGPVPGDRTTFSYGLYQHHVLQEPGSRFYAAYHQRFKYVVDLESGREWLYDVQRDPRAVDDVADEHPAVLAAMRDRVEERLGQH